MNYKTEVISRILTKYITDMLNKNATLISGNPLKMSGVIIASTEFRNKCKNVYQLYKQQKSILQEVEETSHFSYYAKYAKAKAREYKVIINNILSNPSSAYLGIDKSDRGYMIHKLYDMCIVDNIMMIFNPVHHTFNAYELIVANNLITIKDVFTNTYVYSSYAPKNILENPVFIPEHEGIRCNDIRIRIGYDSEYSRYTFTRIPQYYNQDILSIKLENSPDMSDLIRDNTSQIAITIANENGVIHLDDRQTKQFFPLRIYVEEGVSPDYLRQEYSHTLYISYSCNNKWHKCTFPLNLMIRSLQPKEVTLTMKYTGIKNCINVILNDLFIITLQFSIRPDADFDGDVYLVNIINIDKKEV